MRSLTVLAALLTTPAMAQDAPAGNDCVDAMPIAGSVDYRLAALAVRGNSQTYGAASIVDDRLLPSLGSPPPPEKEGDEIEMYVGGVRFNSMFGVLDIPTVEASGGCPRVLKYSTRPLDMASMSFGLGFRVGDWGGFYSTSMTYSFLAADNTALRGMMTGSAAMGMAYGIVAAPFLTGANREAGVVSFQADYVLGLMYDFGLITASAGYVGSNGLYARIGAFDLTSISSVFDDSGIASLDVAIGPFDFGWGDPMLFADRRALVGPGITDAEGKTGAGATDAGAWSTAGLEIRNIGSNIDLRAVWMFEPEMIWSEGVVSYHSAGYHDVGMGGDDFEMAVRLSGGALNRPTMRYYGIAGGVLPTFELDVRYGLGMAVVMGATYNDPERLTLFPFAEGHFAFDYGVEFRY